MSLNAAKSPCRNPCQKPVLQVEAASLESVRDRAELDTLTSYAEQRPLAKREVDVQKFQLRMDPVQQAEEGRQEVLSFLQSYYPEVRGSGRGRGREPPEGHAVEPKYKYLTNGLAGWLWRTLWRRTPEARSYQSACVLCSDVNILHTVPQCQGRSSGASGRTSLNGALDH